MRETILLLRGLKEDLDKLLGTTSLDFLGRKCGMCEENGQKLFNVGNGEYICVNCANL